MFNSVWSGGTLSSKISGLPIGQPLQTGDEFAIARAGANYRVTWQDIINGLTVPSYANIIVVDNGGNGDYTTVSGAMTDATSGDLIILVNDVTEASAITWVNGVSLWIMPGATYTYQPASGISNAFVIGDGVTATIYGPGRILGDGGSLGAGESIGLFSETGSAAKYLNLFGALELELDADTLFVPTFYTSGDMVLRSIGTRYISSGATAAGAVANGDAHLIDCYFDEAYLQALIDKPVRVIGCTLIVTSNTALQVDYDAGSVDGDFKISDCYIEGVGTGPTYALDLVGGPLTNAPVYECTISGGIDTGFTSFDAGTAYATNVQV